MTTQMLTPTYQIRFCPPCWTGVSWGEEAELAALEAAQRYTCDGETLVLHRLKHEDDAVSSMICDAHYTSNATSRSLLEAPWARVQTVPPTSVADDVAYRESLLAALDRNTKNLVDAIHDLTWRIDR